MHILLTMGLCNFSPLTIEESTEPKTVPDPPPESERSKKGGETRIVEVERRQTRRLEKPGEGMGEWVLWWVLWMMHQDQKRREGSGTVDALREEVRNHAPNNVSNFRDEKRGRPGGSQDNGSGKSTMDQ